MPAARRIQWAKFRIGATAFTALLILGVLLSLMLQGRLFQDWQTVRVFVSDASGLYEDAPVRLNGIPVGQVASVRLSGQPDPARAVELTFRIARYHRQRIPSDSIVSITPQNIQGEQFVEISQGRSTAAVPNGGELTFQPTPEVLRALDLAQFERRMRQIDDLLAEIEKGQGALGQLVKGTKLYDGTVQSLIRAEKSLRAAVAPQQAVGQLLYRDTRYEELLEPVRRLDARLAALERGEGSGGRLLRDPRQYDELLQSAAGLRRQVAEANAGRGRWGRFIADDAQYRRWVTQVNGFIRTVDTYAAGDSGMGRLIAGEQPYESLNGAMLQMQQGLRDFRQNPRKYLRMGVF